MFVGACTCKTPQDQEQQTRQNRNKKKGKREEHQQKMAVIIEEEYVESEEMSTSTEIVPLQRGKITIIGLSQLRC
jgi:hypothetical protein